MQTIENKILARLKGGGRGRIFFPSDFSNLGEPRSVLKALERMTNDEKIVRVAKGIYCYPKIDRRLGLSVIYPSIDEIARAVARRDKARIVPTGAQALNLLGLSDQVPMNVVYLTDGSARKLKLYGERGITFQHTAPKNLAFSNELAMLVTFALREVGADNVTEEMATAIGTLLRREPKENIVKDLALMPEWIGKMVRRAYEK
ncbi:MAG: hypothetical protein J5711_05040 [Bacteroidales bacterium]|nr:hypothetical protein [Bacteroidales bacterium]